MRLGDYSQIFSSFYYAVFNRSFDREYRAVLAGRMKHERSPKAALQTRFVRSPSVDYDDLLELSKRRRSVGWLRQEPVPRELIRKAVDVASMSLSTCNRQPFEFHVFDDPELVEELAPLPAGMKGFHHNFPAIVVLVGELRNYYGERDRHLIYIDASLAAMGFVYAAETLGLSTCCINWPDIEEYEQKADEVLGWSLTNGRSCFSP